MDVLVTVADDGVVDTDIHASITTVAIFLVYTLTYTNAAMAMAMTMVSECCLCEANSWK
jgi:hypothetical protein